MIKEISDERLIRYLKKNYESVDYELIRINRKIDERISGLENRLERFEKLVAEKFVQVAKVIG